jgi:hypothetical protein
MTVEVSIEFHFPFSVFLVNGDEFHRIIIIICKYI